MSCQRCSSKRVLSVSGKCSDCFSCDIGEKDHQGYVPDDILIGDSGDYMSFDYCLDCGQIQGTFPLPPTELESPEESSEDEEEFDA